MPTRRELEEMYENKRSALLSVKDAMGANRTSEEPKEITKEALPEPSPPEIVDENVKIANVIDSLESKGFSEGVHFLVDSESGEILTEIDDVSRRVVAEGWKSRMAI